MSAEQAAVDITSIFWRGGGDDEYHAQRRHVQAIVEAEIERMRAERGDIIGYAVIEVGLATQNEIFAYNHPFTQATAVSLAATRSRSRVVVVSELPAVQP